MVIEDDGVGSSEVESQTPHLSGQQEDVNGRVVVEPVTVVVVELQVVVVVVMVWNGGFSVAIGAD